jgi:hypothetical protein
LDYRERAAQNAECLVRKLGLKPSPGLGSGGTSKTGLYDLDLDALRKW